MYGWAEIATLIGNGRTPNQIKRNYHQRLRKRLLKPLSVTSPSNGFSNGDASGPPAESNWKKGLSKSLPVLDPPNHFSVDATHPLSRSWSLNPEVDVAHPAESSMKKSRPLLTSLMATCFTEKCETKIFECYKESPNTVPKVLGSLHERDEETEKTLERHFYWYQKEAENGDKDAQYNLALSYDIGKGTVKNLEKAFY